MGKISSQVQIPTRIMETWILTRNQPPEKGQRQFFAVFSLQLENRNLQIHRKVGLLRPFFPRYLYSGRCLYSNNPSPTWSCDLHVRWRECPWPSLVYDPVGLGQKVLHEKLEGSRDDDGDGGRDLTHLLVTLHYLLYPGLKKHIKRSGYYSKLS